MNMQVRFFEKILEQNAGIPIAYCFLSIVLGNLTLLALFTGMLVQNGKESKEDQDDKYQAQFEQFWKTDEKYAMLGIESESCCLKFGKILK